MQMKSVHPSPSLQPPVWGLIVYPSCWRCVGADAQCAQRWEWLTCLTENGRWQQGTAPSGWCGFLPSRASFVGGWFPQFFRRKSPGFWRSQPVGEGTPQPAGQEAPSRHLGRKPRPWPKICDRRDLALRKTPAGQERAQSLLCCLHPPGPPVTRHEAREQGNRWWRGRVCGRVCGPRPHRACP
jgi:hypothetical protein